MSLSIKALALFAAGALAQRQRLLSPASDINSPAGANAKEPLKWVGANGPWLPGEFVVLHATITIPNRLSNPAKLTCNNLR